MERTALELVGAGALDSPWGTIFRFHMRLRQIRLCVLCGRVKTLPYIKLKTKTLDFLLCLIIFHFPLFTFNYAKILFPFLLNWCIIAFDT